MSNLAHPVFYPRLKVPAGSGFFIYLQEDNVDDKNTYTNKIHFLLQSFHDKPGRGGVIMTIC